MIARRFDQLAWIGLGVTIASAILFWLCNRFFDAQHGDFFYLADAFLHGQVSIDRAAIPPGAIGGQDVIPTDDGLRFFVPFAPFPAIVLLPIVAITGPVVADQWETGINAVLAAATVGLGWWLLDRVGVERLRDRLVLIALLALSTPIWWVTTRGGVWHTGQLIATSLTLLCLIELFGERRRAALVGLLAGFAFLSRAPVAFAVPAYALIQAGDRIWEPRRWPWGEWVEMALGVAPSILFFFWYNLARFGSPMESGYGLAVLSPFLEAQRQLGLFSTAHIRMNVDYLFLKLPTLTNTFPYLRPDGLGMSVLFTSPGLLLAVLAPWRDRRTWILLTAAILVLIPTLLYYGGGWLQFGYRYFLDSIPFIWAMGVIGVARKGQVPWWGWTLILWSVLIGMTSVYWAYNLH